MQRIQSWVLVLALLPLQSVMAQPSTSGPTSAPTTDASRPGDKERIRIARRFLNAVQKNQYDAARKPLTETMRQAMTPEFIVRTWSTIIKDSGAFVRLEEPYIRQVGEFRIVYVPANFIKKSRTFKVVFDAENRISGFWIEAETPVPDYLPPKYDHSDRYTSENVEFGKAPWTAKGILTLPKDVGPAPVLVLVHGSGPHDEDETIGPNKPFRDLAAGLSSNGIAVLRYVKRTRGHAAELVKQGSITVRQEVIDDALAALEYVRTRPDLDPNRVFLLGHSLGATLGPAIATEDGRLAGLIMMAGTARDFFDVVMEQLSYIASLPGPEQDQNKKALKQAERTVRRLRGGEDPTQIHLLGAPGDYWLELSQYGQDSLTLAERLKCRILILGGGRDYQVTRKDFDLYQEHLKDDANVSMEWFKNVNHLFMTGQNKATPNEYMSAGNIDRRVIQHITAWLKNSKS